MTRLTWLGHSGFLLESAQGSRVAVDVWTKAPTYARGVDLTGLRTLLLTHGHFDHAESAPEVCQATGARVVAIFEVALWAKQQGVKEAVDMNKGGTVAFDGWRFTMVDAVHSSGCPGPADGIVSGGAAAGFVIETPDGERVYHAGDTAVFGDMRLIAELHRPQVALLPIGGHYTMGPREAAKAASLLGVEHVVPMHYGTFPLLAGTPDELRETLGPNVLVHALESGGSLDLSQLVLVA